MYMLLIVKWLSLGIIFCSPLVLQAISSAFVPSRLILSKIIFGFSNNL